MAAEEPHIADGQQYPGGRPVKQVGIYLLLGYILFMTLLTFTSLVVLWPPIRPEGKLAAQAALEGVPTPTPSPAAPAPTAQGGAAAQNPPPATPSPTPSPTPDMRDEHLRIFNGRCTDVYGKPREGVSPLKIPFVNRLGIPVMTPRCVYDEDRLLLIVLFAGSLGGLVHALRSLGWYIGNRRLKWSWAALYFLTPFVGAAIALVFYFVIRGGFFSPTSSVSDTSPFGFAAVAALIGMFTEEAINKLRSVAETLLTPKEQGRDHAGPAPVVTSISPPSGPTAGGTSVSLAGDNFQPGVVVTFGGGIAAVDSVEAKLLKVRTPPHAAGQVDVVVTNTDKQSQVSAKGFEYRDDPAPPGGAPPAPPGPPTISAVRPSTGRTAGGEPLTVTGTNFVEGASVTFGGQDATGVVVKDANTITLLTPPAAVADTVQVVVKNPDGGSSTDPVGFTYNADA